MDMDALYELKEKLMKELEEYGNKEMTPGSLEVVDKLAHAVKNLCKVIEAYEEEEYSQRGSYDGGQGGGSYRGGGRYSRMGGGSYRGGQNSYYDRDGSYARGRGQNARRDSQGRYSSHGDPGEMVDQLEMLMQDAPNEQIKQQIRQLVQQIEQM